MYRILTMERLYATGGNEICRRVAKELGYKLYDTNILTDVAKRLELPAIYIKDLEETVPGSVLFNLYQTSIGGSKNQNRLPLSEKVFLEEKAIIEERAASENCVIAGRCASWILRDREDVLKVFVYSDSQNRIKRTMEYNKIDEERAENLMYKNDKRRREFFNSHTDVNWEAKSTYDICLNSDALGMDTCVEILVKMMRG